MPRLGVDCGCLVFPQGSLYLEKYTTDSRDSRTTTTINTTVEL